jgi:hypothetical protein
MLQPCRQKALAVDPTRLSSWQFELRGRGWALREPIAGLCASVGSSSQGEAMIGRRVFYRAAWLNPPARRRWSSAPPDGARRG